MERIWGSAPNFKSSYRCNLAVDCTISLKFCRVFLNVTVDVLQKFKINGSEFKVTACYVIWSPNNCSVLGNRDAEFNGDVRILMENCELLVHMHVQYKIQNEWRDVRRPQVAMHSQLPHFIVCIGHHMNGIFICCRKGWSLCFIILAEDKLHFFKEQKTDSKSVSESFTPSLNFLSQVFFWKCVWTNQIW